MEVLVTWEPEDLKDADVVFIGIPWEGGQHISPKGWTSFGPRESDPGAILGWLRVFEMPEYIRK